MQNSYKLKIFLIYSLAAFGRGMAQIGAVRDRYRPVACGCCSAIPAVMALEVMDQAPCLLVGFDR